jgi:enoyl-CoA hydratase/carnithine racemase
VAGLLSIDLDGAVALVTLQRPEKRNALSIDLRLELADAFGRLADDPGVSCVVLTGAGSAFCAGMDVTQFGGDRAHKQQLVDSSLAAFGAVARFPKPLVGAVNGPAIAGGFVLVLHCDLLIAAETARFGFPELPRGIPPSYAAALGGLPEPVARDMCLTGRMMEAPEALHHALVTEVVPDGAVVERSLAVASGIAKQPLETLLEVKRRFRLAADHARGPLFADEERAFRAALLGEDDPEPAA